MNRCLAPSVAMTCIFALSVGVRAEPTTVQSIEWVAAQSDRIVVGKIVEVGFADETECETITVAVTKALKGERTERIQFVVSKGYSGGGKEWLDEGIPMMFFLVKTDVERIPVSDKKYPWAIRGDGRFACAVLLGKSKRKWNDCMEPYTRSCEILEKSDDISRHVEKAVKLQGDRKISSHMIDVPGGTAVWEKLFAQNAVFLYVPVDEALEELGQTWCKSDNPWMRQEGAKALRHFKNDKNIALLKTLLNDPSARGETSSEYVGRKTVYYVRKEAHDVLRGFGVDVPPVVLETGPVVDAPKK